MKKNVILTGLYLCLQSSFAQLSPEITSWIVNSDTSTGYGGIPSNVQLLLVVF